MTFLTAIYWFNGDEIILYKKEAEPDYRGMAIHPEQHVDKWQEVVKDWPELADMVLKHFRFLSASFNLLN